MMIPSKISKGKKRKELAKLHGPYIVLAKLKKAKPLFLLKKEPFIPFFTVVCMQV